MNLFTETILIIFYLGTCELQIFVRIESQIELAATIRIQIKSGCSRLRVECWLPSSSSSSHHLVWRPSARAQQRLTGT